jgi:hypothetical protein
MASGEDLSASGKKLNIIIADNRCNPFKITTQIRPKDREGVSEVVLNLGRHDHVSPFWRREHWWAAPPGANPFVPAQAGDTIEIVWSNPRQPERDHGPLARRSNDHHAGPVQRSDHHGHAAARRGIHDIGSTQASKSV